MSITRSTGSAVASDVTRVTALEPSGNLYGSEYCLLDIVEGTRSDFEWEIVLPAGGGFDALLEAKHIPVARLLKRDSHSLSLVRKVPGYLRVWQHLAKTRPSVIYVNQAGMLRAATVMTKGINASLVCQIQTLEDARFVAGLEEEQAAVTTFICNSHFIASQSGVASNKLTVLYQPIMPGNRPAVRAQIQAGPPWRIGILGRISESKGHYLLIEAARILLARRNDLQFVVIGAGLTPADTERFTGALRNAGVSDAFEMRGYRRAAHEELASLHLSVIPSIAEPYGRVLLDAAATRTPVVVSDGGGLGELARHFDIGRRFTSGDPQSLSQSIESAIASYDSERAQFNAASSAMINRLDPDKYLDAVKTVINNAVSGLPTSLQWLGEDR